MEENCILHKILNANVLNLRLEVLTSLLPYSEVNLHDMCSYGPVRKKKKHVTLGVNIVSCQIPLYKCLTCYKTPAGF